eukprot:s4128_g2.t1
MNCWDEYPTQTTMGILLPKLLDIWPGTRLRCIRFATSWVWDSQIAGGLFVGRVMAKLVEFVSMPVPPRHVRLTPRETKVSRGTEEERLWNSWTKRQRHWRNIKAQLAAKVAEKQAQQREKPLTLIGGGEKPHLPPLPKSLQHAQIPAKDVEQIQSTYHWRPCQLSEHVYAADLPGRSLGTYVNTLSYDLGKETLQAGLKTWKWGAKSGKLGD